MKRLVLCICCSFLLSLRAEETNGDASSVRTRLLDVLFTGALDAELDIIESQREKLNTIHLDAQKRMSDEVDDIGQLINKGRATPNMMREAQARVDKATMEKISEVLLPAQEHRWSQIAMHLLFPKDRAPALLTVESQKSLGISDEQRKKMADVFAAGESSIQKKIAEMRREREEQMLKILSLEQRRGWSKMFGEPFPRKVDEGTTSVEQ